MQTPAPDQTANRRIARAAATVMAAFIFSSLVGLLRGIVIAHAFGTSENLDSFNSANRLTELLFNLVAGGALASAFIPTFSGFLTRDDRPGAWRLACAALLPGAVLPALGLVLYGLQAVDIFGLGYFGTVHFLVGWVYLLAAPVFAPRLSSANICRNPFHA